MFSGVEDRLYILYVSMATGNCTKREGNTTRRGPRFSYNAVMAVMLQLIVIRPSRKSIMRTYSTYMHVCAYVHE